MRFDPNLHVVIDDIVTSKDIAKMLGTTAPAVSNWKVRYEDFPAPFLLTSDHKGSLYRRSDVLRWYEVHFPERVAALRTLATMMDIK